MTTAAFSCQTDLGFLDRNAVHALQTRLLNEHLRHCRRQSPFYRRLLAGVPDREFTLEDLALLPTTSKPDLSRHNQDFLAGDDQRVADVCFTSGTTGTPCQITYSRRDLDRLAYNDAVGFLAAGFRPGQRILLTCTIDRCFIAGLAYYRGVVAMGGAAIRNGLNTIDSHAQIIAAQRPRGIVGVPSFLARLGDSLREQGVDASCIETIVCIGEPVRRQDMSLTPLGQKLEDFWPRAAHSTYASSEIATSFTECRERCGGHPPADLALVEILSDDGRPLPPGEVGEVTVTPLQVESMPLLRFRTGDIGFLLPEPCPCGRVTPRLGPILGRRAQMLKVRGTTIFPNAFFAVLDSLAGVADYYLEITGTGLSDEVAICAAVTDGAALTAAEITEKVYSRTRIHVKTTLVPPEQARQRIYGQSRKPVRFFDYRKG
ncbi:MAG: AMP-binding protein [Lentisphaeria bacterium]|jgi:phenylacetate-CoA ligase|nr:AMP-binding protein [Lentisphaeria bacterium]